jgi:peptidyl-prolyl cis-trans isomerase C
LRRFLIPTILLLLALVITACSGESDASANDAAAVAATQAPSMPTATTAPNQPTPTVPVNAAGEELVARVNGEGITRTEFDRALERSLQQSEAVDRNALAATVLDVLIEQRVIEQAAADMGITITQAEIDAEFDANRASAPSIDAWNEWLANNMYTEEEYRATLRGPLLTNQVRDTIATNDTESVTQVRARHILVNTEAEANAIIRRLQNGEAFADLARALSQDVTTREQGGDLGWFIREDLSFTPELAEVALEMQPGQVAGPVPTMLGYHIIQTLEVGERAAEPSDEARIVEAKFADWLADQLAEADIERYLRQGA